MSVRWFTERTYYLRGDFNDPAAYTALARRMTEAAQRHRTGENCLFYLATPPQVFTTIVDRLGQASLTSELDGRWRRVVVEKPFGTDLQSARALNRHLLGVLGEGQIFRIDHYLGKETVQNILVLRFANSIFEPIWNRRYIDHVQITVAEEVDVGRRGGYYDDSGVLRDMFQNHLLQLMMITAMEWPARYEADLVR